MTASTTVFEAATEQQKPSRVSPVSISAAIVVASHLFLVPLHLANLWRAGRYGYFPYLILYVAYLIWWRSRWGRITSSESRLVPERWMAASAVVLTCAVLLWSPWLAAVSAILAGRAALIEWGQREGRSYRAEWMLLWLLLPLPLGLDVQLSNALLFAAARWSSWIIDIFGYTHRLVGGDIRLSVGVAMRIPRPLHSMRAVSTYLFRERRCWILHGSSRAGHGSSCVCWVRGWVSGSTRKVKVEEVRRVSAPKGQSELLGVATPGKECPRKPKPRRAPVIPGPAPAEVHQCGIAQHSNGTRRVPTTVKDVYSISLRSLCCLLFPDALSCVSRLPW